MFDRTTLVRSRSNSFCRTDNANCADLFGSMIDRDRTALLTMLQKSDFIAIILPLRTWLFFFCCCFLVLFISKCNIFVFF